MENTFKGYVNYGCLAAEKRNIYTAGNQAATATVSEAVEYILPEGWELAENAAGNPILVAPWGWSYEPNEVLGGNEYPHLIGKNKEGERFKIKMEYNML